MSNPADSGWLGSVIGPLQGREQPAHWLLSLPVLILLVAVSCVGAGPWMPLFDLDEGAFSEATRELLASGNWVSTFLNGEPRYDKPILIYWLQALSVSALGLDGFALRLPSMLAACGWIFAVYRFGREFFDELTARLAVWVLASCWLATVIFKAAIADALLNWLLCLIFFDLYRYCQYRRQAILLRLGLYMGLGFLTKGPVAVVLPLLTSLIVLSWQREAGVWWRALINIRSWAPFVLVVLPWHLAVYLDQGWGFFQGFYLGHNLGRFSSTMENHGGSVFYYVLLLPLLLLPFSGRLLIVIRQWRQQPLAPGRFLAVWFVLTLLIFSLSQTQLPHYLLYGMTPLFLLIAQSLARMLAAQQQPGRLELGVAMAAMLGFVLLPFTLAPLAAHSHRLYEAALLELAAENFSNDFLPVTLLLMVAMLLVLIGPRMQRLTRLLLAGLLIMLTTNLVLLPVIASAQQGPVKVAGLRARDYPGEVVAFKINMPSFSVYSQRIVSKRRPQAGDLVFTRIDAVTALLALDPTIAPLPVYQAGGIALYQFGSLNMDRRNSDSTGG